MFFSDGGSISDHSADLHLSFCLFIYFEGGYFKMVDEFFCFKSTYKDMLFHICGNIWHSVEVQNPRGAIKQRLLLTEENQSSSSN